MYTQIIKIGFCNALVIKMWNLLKTMIIILKTLEPFQDSESENDFTSSPSHNVEPEDDEDRPSKVVESLKVKTGSSERSLLS